MAEPFRTVVMTAAGLHKASDCVYKLVHSSHASHLAWSERDRWTQYERGRVFTYEEAEEIQKMWDDGTMPSSGMDEGRWYAHALRIPLRDTPDPARTQSSHREQTQET